MTKPATDPKTTDKPPTDPPPDPGTDQEKGIRKIVSDVLGDLFATGKAGVTDKPTAPPRERDIAAEVMAAVKAAKTEEQRDSLLAGLKGDVENLKAAKEKQPLVVRKVEQIMGWRNGDDET